MRLTYSFTTDKLNSLRHFITASESSISENEQRYHDALSDLSRKYEQERNVENNQFKKSIEEVSNNIAAIQSKAKQLAEGMLAADADLCRVDKYYCKTKKKSADILGCAEDDKYKSGGDYLSILEDLSSDFSHIARRYQCKRLPGVINWLNYLLSGRRKKDYVRLILLLHTAQKFLSEMQGDIGSLRSELIQKIDQTHNDNLSQIENGRQSRQKELISSRQNQVLQIVDTISTELNNIFDDGLIDDMNKLISDFSHCQDQITTDDFKTFHALNMGVLCVPLSDIVHAESLLDFVKDQLGRLIITQNNEDWLILPFGAYNDETSNWFIEWDNDREFVQQLVHGIMFAAIAKAPVGCVQFTVIDPVSRGSSIRPFFDARKNAPGMFGERIYFNANDIDNKLSEISSYIDDTMQTVLGTTYSSIFEYAKKNDDYVAHISFVVIFDFPKGVNDSTIELINNIVLQGPACGVFTIIANSFEDDRSKSTFYAKLLNSIVDHSCHVALNGHEIIIGNEPVQFFVDMPDRVSFNNYIERYLLIQESIKNRGLVFPSMIKTLMMSNDAETLSSQILAVRQCAENLTTVTAFDIEDGFSFPEAVGIGTIHYPKAVFEECYGYDQIAKYFSNHSDFISLPFSLDLKGALNLILAAEEDSYCDVISFSHCIIDKFLSNIPAGALNVCVVDVDKRGQSVVPFLDLCSRLPGVFSGGIVSEQNSILESFKRILTRIDDITVKKLGSKFSNLFEYNDTREYDVEPVTLLVVYDYVEALNDTLLTDLIQIIKNGNRCGIFTVLCEKKTAGKKVSAYTESLIESITKLSTTLEVNGQSTFRLVPFSVSINPLRTISFQTCDNFADRYRSAMQFVEERRSQIAPDNSYTSIYDLSIAPNYIRGNKHLHLPYGISADGELYYCDFENENFAAFLCGSAGSGKSTLLHSLITGILMNNHPDDVEIWLADFKMMEFRRYVNHRPPHIKYILLEESADSVYDFLDRLRDKLSERERLNSQFTDFAKAPVSQYMPLIFVIIDEFSIMSQIIEQDPDYKLILQNLLAKGRALGFRFLFSSQTFTTGVTGLTLTAKKQIQMRLAMKAPQDEISETIDMSRSLMSEEQKRWLLTLPKYYILLKKLVGEGESVSGGIVQDEVTLTRAKGLFFPDYGIQEKYINLINSTYHPVLSYDPTDPLTYQDKHSVVADGSILYSFEGSVHDMQARLNEIRNGSDYLEDATQLFLGRPRSMQTVREIAIENEFEENMLLFGSNPSFVSSVVLSAIKSALQSGAEVSLLGHNKNRIVRTLSANVVSGFAEFITDEANICSLIHDIKTAIDNGTQSRHFIVILGLDVLLRNMEFLARAQNRTKEDSVDVISDRVPSELMVEDRRSTLDYLAQLEAELGITEGSAQSQPGPSASATKPIQAHKEQSRVYDIRADFDVILREGPRLGYHVIAGFRSFDEFKQVKYSADLFKHRVTFQCSKEDSRNIIGSSEAFGLSEGAFLYSNMQTSFSMRPYLHRGIEWNGWTVDEDGNALRE